MKKNIIVSFIFSLSSCWLINAQGLDYYTFFEINSLKVNTVPKLKGWKDSPKKFKEIKKDIEAISFLVHQKETKYKFIDDLLVENKLPSVFGYLPVILSGYQSDNLNKQGGAGIWSLSYITALQQRLLMNRLVDERKNDSISTLAAVKDLERLIGLYEDPRWAILAFISSPSYVSNIFNKANNSNWLQAVSFIDDLFLDKIEFIYFLKELTFEKDLSTEKSFQDIISCQLKNNLTFDAISQYLKINFKLFQTYNPSLINNIIPAEYNFKINTEHGKSLLTNQDNIFSFQDSMVKNQFFIEDTMVRKTHEVKAGDVLGLIAEKYQVKVKDIMRWNNLQSTVIYIGQKVEIYSNEEYSHQKFEYYEITKNDSYWKITNNLPKHNLVDILNYNKYESIKTEKRLRIINK